MINNTLYDNAYKYYLVQYHKIARLDSFNGETCMLDKNNNAWIPSNIKEIWLGSSNAFELEDITADDALAIRNALCVSREAHEEQKDKGGNDYYLHPIAVSDKMVRYLVNNPAKLQVVALLHDTVEDTDVTLDNIYNWFGGDVYELVDLLTHKEGMSYEDYIRNIETNREAMIVKLADLETNSDLSRIKNPTEKDYQRAAKYKHYIAEIKEILDEE